MNNIKIAPFAPIERAQFYYYINLTTQKKIFGSYLTIVQNIFRDKLGKRKFLKIRINGLEGFDIDTQYYKERKMDARILAIKRKEDFQEFSNHTVEKFFKAEFPRNTITNCVEIDDFRFKMLINLLK